MSKLLAAIVVIGLLPALFPAALAAGDKTKDRDFEELKKIFGANKVTIVLSNNPTPLPGRLTSSRELFGRKYLILTGDAGRVTLVDVAAIAAIRQDP